MRAKIWFNGDITFSEDNHGATVHEHLKRGNIEVGGRYGKGSRRRFISRCEYMYFDRGQLPCYSICLTYRDQPSVEDSRSNVNAFLQWYRRRNLRAYAWSLELQERKKSGLAPTIHYHMLVNAEYVPVSEINQAWSRIRQDESPNAVRDVRILQTATKAFQYAIKYAQYMSKAADQKKHKVDLSDYRLWATSRNLSKYESVSVNDTSFALALMEKCGNVREIELENGFRIWQGSLKHSERSHAMNVAREINRFQIDEIERQNRALQERKQREVHKTMVKELKRSQKDLFAS